MYIVQRPEKISIFLFKQKFVGSNEQTIKSQQMTNKKIGFETQSNHRIEFYISFSFCQVFSSAFMYLGPGTVLLQGQLVPVVRE